MWCVACNQPPAADAPIEAAKARRFVAYQAQLVPLVQNWATKKQDGDERGSLAQQMETAREAAGLTDRDVAALSELGTLIAVRDEALQRELAKQVTETEKAQKSLAEAGKTQLERLQRIQSNLVELQEMRQKHGDAIVDAMLKEAPELKRQHEAFAKLVQ